MATVHEPPPKPSPEKARGEPATDTETKQDDKGLLRRERIQVVFLVLVVFVLFALVILAATLGDLPEDTRYVPFF